MATNPFTKVVDALTTQVAAVTKIKGEASDTPEAKVGKLARQLANALTVEGDSAPTMPEGFKVDAFTKMVAPLTKLGPAPIDTQEGDALATRLSGILALDQQDRRALGMTDALAKAATEQVDAWRALTAKKKGARGSTGTGGNQPNAYWSTFGVSAINLTIKGEGVDLSFHRTTTKSDISNEITQACKAWMGDKASDAQYLNTRGRFTYSKVDPAAHKAWAEAVTAIEGGKVGPFTLTIHAPGRKDTLVVTLTAERAPKVTTDDAPKDAPTTK